MVVLRHSACLYLLYVLSSFGNACAYSPRFHGNSGTRAMTIKRWVAVIGVIALVIWFGVILTVALAPRGVTGANDNRIKKDMTKREIHAILGGFFAGPYQIQEVGNGAVIEWWIGYGGCAKLSYDEHGKIVWREWELYPHCTYFPENIFHPVQWPID